jgi:hypothetical protein
MRLESHLCITSRPSSGNFWLKTSILPSFERVWYVMIRTHNSVQELSVALVDSKAKIVTPFTTHPLEYILKYIHKSSASKYEQRADTGLCWRMGEVRVLKEDVMKD